MASRNNRSAGLRTEREVIRKIASALGLVPYNGKNALSCDVGSTRAFSKVHDDLGIDIYFSERELDDLAIQIKEKSCKGKALTINAEQLPNTDGIDVLVTKLTRKSKKGRHVSKGMYATLPMDDFLQVLNELYSARKKGAK